LTLVVHAPNVHLGGGRALLLALLSTLSEPAVVQLDERLAPLPNLAPSVRVIWVTPSLVGRLQAEHRLQLLCRSGDILLCFGNLPPLFRNSARVFVYLQNRYLTSSRLLSGLPWSARLRIRIERLWLRHRLNNASLLVQTETMLQDVQENFGCEASVLPYLPREVQTSVEKPPVLFDYLYVASGEPHKNHRRLLQAWVLLAKRGFRPSLCLTLDTQRDATLCAWVERLVRKHCLRVANNPVLPSEIFGLYEQCSALIYPSLFESFGLPLLEARQVGMTIVAAERDYVRDVVVPVESFDPESEVSIARAVIRHQNGKVVEPALPGDAANFLERLSALV
jgi:glycosyltransferase involved in cell wall biosynthesis